MQLCREEQRNCSHSHGFHSPKQAWSSRTIQCAGQAAMLPQLNSCLLSRRPRRFAVYAAKQTASRWLAQPLLPHRYGHTSYGGVSLAEALLYAWSALAQVCSDPLAPGCSSTRALLGHNVAPHTSVCTHVTCRFSHPSTTFCVRSAPAISTVSVKAPAMD